MGAGVGAAAITTTRAVIVAVRRAGKWLNMVRSTASNSRDQMRGDNLEKAGVEPCLYTMFVRFCRCTPTYCTKCRVV